MAGAEILELLARGGAVGGFVGLAIVVGRGGVSPTRITGILFCLAAAAHALTQYPPIETALGWSWPPIWALSVAGAGLFWAFATELFEDRAKLEPRRFIPALALLAVGIAGALAPKSISPALWFAHNLIGAALMIHVLIVIAAGWRGDLVEPRRRLRGPVLAAAAIYALIVTIVQAGELLLGSAEALSPLAALSLVILSLLGLGVFARADPELFGPVRGLKPEAPAPAPADASSEDAASAAALDRLMRVDRLYREAGLTISALAARLRMPEHKMRRLINRQLGYRNFSAFLNQWRLADAKQGLADPAQREVPISTIALDAGFQSLGPFNRAFKAETDLTPSEFRMQALASGGGADSAPKPAS